MASVLILRLPEAAIARACDGGTSTLADRIASAARDIGTANGIPYVKMMGTVIVAAAGLSAPDHAAVSDAASRLADAAISLRELCSGLLETADDEADFGLGLDAGPVLGGVLCAGKSKPNAGGIFNLWGEAFRGAEALAGSAPSGTIQASEQSFLLLRKTFLFRPRGLFHRPGTGDARSYVLAGRA
jgi:class 3 adenylate cyclase